MSASHGLADTSLVAFAPCGCWFAVMIESVDFAENAKRTTEFMRDIKRGGGGRVERMTHEEWKALRNGVNGDKKWGCDHDPEWGGLVSNYDECPRCGKDVKKLKGGGLAAHKALGLGWSAVNCSQEPWTRAVSS